MKATRFLLLLAAGCSLGRPDRERMGDIAWHEGRWSDATAAYKAAGESPQLTAKLADVAMQQGALSDAAEAWTRLGVDAPERAGEAAAGLARVAAAAEHEGKQAALAGAIAGLRRVAPGWPLGRTASRLGGVSIPPALLADVIPALLASSLGRESTEPLLLALGQAERARGACERGVPTLEVLVRRTANAAIRDTAATTLASCELGLGTNALLASHPGMAEHWFADLAERDPHGAAGRRAEIGVGDARLRQGDTVSARLAWQSLVTADAPPDSLTAMALLRIQALMPAVTIDSGALHPGRP